MNIQFALSAFFFSITLVAQQNDTLKIKASDPTQLYTFVEGYAGLNFIAYPNGLPEIDTWQFGFRGNWAMKKFRIGVDLSASNNSTQNRILDDIKIDLGYQVHNNTGIYNTTLINVGFTSPTIDDGSLFPYNDLSMAVYPNTSTFYKIHVNYRGAVKISDKFAFYPGVEWFTKKNNPDALYIFFDQDSSYSRSTVFSTGWKFSGTLSYDINPKNFVQIYAAWSTENWEAKYGSIPEQDAYFSGFSEKRWMAHVNYQHAFTPYAQAYAKLLYHDYRFDDGDPRTDSYEGLVSRLYSFQLGFIYFLH